MLHVCPCLFNVLSYVICQLEASLHLSASDWERLGDIAQRLQTIAQARIQAHSSISSTNADAESQLLVQSSALNCNGGPRMKEEVHTGDDESDSLEDTPKAETLAACLHSQVPIVLRQRYCSWLARHLCVCG